MKLLIIWNSDIRIEDSYDATNRSAEVMWNELLLLKAMGKIEFRKDDATQYIDYFGRKEIKHKRAKLKPWQLVKKSN